MIKTTKDGRTIRTGKDYTKFRADLYVKQNASCIECDQTCVFDAPLEWNNSFHVAHHGSRGMGGAIRDDVVGPKRGQVEGGLCGKCHRESHGQQ